MERIKLLIGLVLTVGLASSAAAADSPKSQAAGKSGPQAQEQEQVVTVASMPVFVPPNRGAPMARLGGATRSASTDSLPRIEALVPEEPGWTLEEQPVLYWYLEKPTDVQIDFVLMSLDPSKTLLDTQLPRPKSAGVQRIRLADLGVSLEPEVGYQWLVKLVPNPKDRSYDRVVGGGIKWVPPSHALEAKLAAPGASRSHVLAKAGIWYDAIDDLSTQIEAHPDNRMLWNQRAALFEQVGLPAIPLQSGAAPAFGRR